MIPLAAHADWSVSPAKRWMSLATPLAQGWHVTLEKVGDLPTLFARLRARAQGAPIVLGIDAPIGLPHAYLTAYPDFPSFLRARDPADPFFTVCEHAAEISHARPFYPRLPRAGMRRHDLLDRLGLTADQLLRHCERRTPTQPAAAPMFWTLGANQVGKGALCLWRDLLLPALHGDDPPALWPFDGPLATLLRPGRLAIAETYPANAMRELGILLKGSKRRQSDRAAVASTLEARLRDLNAAPDPALAAQIAHGFGPAQDGEDRFDSLIGLLRILQLIRDPTLDQLPAPEICRWEGWILGRPVNIS